MIADRFRNIAIVTPNTDTFSNPSLFSLFELGKEHDVGFILIGPKQKVAINSKVVIHEFIEVKKSIFSIKGKVITFFRLLIFFRRYKLKTVIAIDPQGLAVVGLFRKLKIIKRLIYWSFEIFPLNEISNEYFIKIKEGENLYSKYVDLLIIQDENRKLLLENNGFNLTCKTMLIPVSLIPINYIESNILRDQFKINNNKIVVVYSGSIAEWSGIGDVIKEIKGFPKAIFDKITFVFHNRYQWNNSCEISSVLLKLSLENESIRLSSQPFDTFSELLSFLSAADIGIVSYKPNLIGENPYIGQNISEIGLASGKFSLYAHLGLAIMGSNQFIELNKKYNFGVILDDKKPLKKSIEEIIDNIEYYKKNSRILYSDILNPKKKISLLFDYLV